MICSVLPNNTWQLRNICHVGIYLIFLKYLHLPKSYLEQYFLAIVISPLRTQNSSSTVIQSIKMHLKGNLVVINSSKQKERKKKCNDKIEAIILKSKDKIYLLKHNPLNLTVAMTSELTQSHFISTGIKVINYQDLGV